MTTYRITFRNKYGNEKTVFVISSSTVGGLVKLVSNQAVADLHTLGYKFHKVTYCFPAN